MGNCCCVVWLLLLLFLSRHFAYTLKSPRQRGNEGRAKAKERERDYQICYVSTRAPSLEEKSFRGGFGGGPHMPSFGGGGGVRRWFYNLHVVVLMA